MRLGIMSDSHDHLINIKKAVDIFNQERVDLVLHCGDFIAPFAVRPLAHLNMRVIACYGNNDGEKVYLQRTFDELSIDVHVRNHCLIWHEHRILIMHEPDMPEIFAASGQFDLICYGHTHQALIEKTTQTLLVNPGETCGWLTNSPTIAIADLAEKNARLIAL